MTTTNIDIRIIGTTADVKLLKKILNYYLDNKATETEKHHIETYLGLIDHAVKKASKKL